MLLFKCPFPGPKVNPLCTNTYVKTNPLLKIKMSKQTFMETKEIKRCINFFLEVRGFRVLSAFCAEVMWHLLTLMVMMMMMMIIIIIIIITSVITRRRPCTISNFVLGSRWLEATIAER